MAYLLNFTHDFQPHQHFVNDCCEFITSAISNSQYEDYHQPCVEHDSDSHEKGMQFPHQHISRFHEFPQIRNIQPEVFYPNIVVSNQFEFTFYHNESDIVNNNNIETHQFYQEFICSALGLRAPPTFI